LATSRCNGIWETARHNRRPRQLVRDLLRPGKLVLTVGYGSVFITFHAIIFEIIMKNSKIMSQSIQLGGSNDSTGEAPTTYGLQSPGGHVGDDSRHCCEPVMYRR